MFEAVDAIALLRAVLADACASDEVARRHLDEARQRRMDPLDYAAHQFGLGNSLVWCRAAIWAGYRFAEHLPAHPALPCASVARLEHLRGVRSLRQHALGEDLAFIAPTFDSVRRLRASWRHDLHRRIRFATPEAIETAIARAASAQLMDYARTETTVRWKGASAGQLGRPTRIGFAVLLALTILLVMLSGVVARPFLIPVVALLLMAPGVLRVLAALPGPAAQPVRPLTDVELPLYTVLIPLRDEAQMVPMLRRAMSAIDYPPHRLDIKFVVEAKSPETVAAVEQVLGDPHFRMVVVPQGAPHTKPKAIDYALPLVRGEFVVVYDAEDVPEPDQLRRAAERFRADATLACLQAELVPENAHENVLTALFAGEYAGLFGRLLPALARWDLPVPLGGTSNHFRTSVLRKLGGWDAFNVTEDADLGVRLARRGYRAETFTSRTHEEAPLTLGAWMAQRTRWMKGWMQTYLVHARTPRRLLGDLGWKAFLGFHILVGGMIMSSLLHTLFLGTLLARLMLDGVAGLLPQDVWDWLALCILTAGYGGAFAVVLSGLIHLRDRRLMAIQLLVPLYWVLHSIAALLAARELIVAPTSWAKTTHGVTRMARTGAIQRGAEALRPRIG
ncbi:MAG: glycosyltransferase [Devosia sp.]|uniref:glycosyltransferase family 2 protein n=1 Tax=Devosia sp. 66-22 TaxID=1895753 RepID=UPI001AC4EC64|nr:glycosyltransferase family 2 protein [Devosia sp. 66-22]MBN9348379.1 glycosyltransferase [Devosia sp.]